MKHTKGKCITTFNANRERGVRTDGGYICLIPKPTHYPGQDERYEREMEENKANAELIAEAFNVTNETGFTPRQLADQKAELLEALIDAEKVLVALANRGHYPLELMPNEKENIGRNGFGFITKAIQKATP